MSEEPILTEVELEEVLVGTQIRLNQKQLRSLSSSLKGRQLVEFATRNAILQLEAFVYRDAERSPTVTKHVERPADWWSAFKQRFFPRWALWRWPARIERIPVYTEVVRMCPHLEFDHEDPNGRHLRFLIGDSNHRFPGFRP